MTEGILVAFLGAIRPTEDQLKMKTLLKTISSVTLKRIIMTLSQKTK